MIDTFSQLPEHLAEGLLQGGVGKLHLLQLADICFQAAADPPGRPDLLDLGARLLAAAWEADMLDAPLGRQLLGLPPKRLALAPAAQSLCRAVAAHWEVPPAAGPFFQLLRNADPDPLQNYLETRLDEEPGNLFWLQQAVGLAAFERRFEWIAGKLHAHNNAALAPLVQKLRADIAFLQGDYATAAAKYAATLRHLPLAPLQTRLAETLFRLGKRDAAVGLWRQALAAQPWNVNLLLRLHDCLHDAASQAHSFDAPLAVLIYTFNKAADLDATLERLWQSGSIRWPAVRLCVLNNGATDDTRQVLARWGERFGQAMDLVKLPVNVGAAAARNWLARVESLADCSWRLYLDDDALVPDNWLELFAAATVRYPEAAVWGCRVLDAVNPAVLQHVDLHLTDAVEPAAKDPIAPSYAARFAFSMLQHQDLDFGQFDYLRPCVSVTGCCHLFRSADLLSQPGFDLRFSPSQYDDADHDLAVAAAGGYAVYQGRLAVLHRRRSGRACRLAAADKAHAYGNLYKLQMKYSPATLASIRVADRRRLLADIEKKIEQLNDAGLLHK